MKMKPEHYQHIENLVKEVDTEICRKAYIRRDPSIRNIEKSKDLDMRYRWDLFNYAVPVKWTCDNLYTYLDDTHIDTALRRIVPKLGD